MLPERVRYGRFTPLPYNLFLLCLLVLQQIGKPVFGRQPWLRCPSGNNISMLCPSFRSSCLVCSCAYPTALRLPSSRLVWKYPSPYSSIWYTSGSILDLVITSIKIPINKSLIPLDFSFSLHQVHLVFASWLFLASSVKIPICMDRHTYCL